MWFQNYFWFQNHFAIEVERSKSCIALTMKTDPTSCIFNDILKLIKNPPKTKTWQPAKLKLVQYGNCCQHKDLCLIYQNRVLKSFRQLVAPVTLTLGPHTITLMRCRITLSSDSCGLIGAPCILFSKCPRMLSKSWWTWDNHRQPFFWQQS